MLITFIARQKFRFDLGTSFMSIINFSFIVIAASDKLVPVFHLPVLLIIAIVVPAAIVAVWLFGYTLDKINFFEAYRHEENNRNIMLKEIHTKNL